MPLFDLKQEYGSEEGTGEGKKPLTFKDFARIDISSTFFRLDEFAEVHTVDGKEAPVVIEETTLKPYSAHWEGGAKQNFDTGLYTAYTLLYIRVEDYGPKPQVNKPLVMDMGTDHQRTYFIRSCETEDGVYRIKMERPKQSTNAPRA